jgi:hypothetical protein
MSTPRFDLPPPVSKVSDIPSRPTLFLSASVPERRPPEDFEPSDRQAAMEINADYVDHALPDRIRAAVVELTRVALKRPQMRLAFGAHPSISPMILQVARDMNAPPDSILVFQSNAYRQIIPGSTLEFANWSCGQLILTAEQPEAPFIATPTSTGKKLRRLSPYANSLRFMRELMVSVPGTCGAVFVGGMNGVEDEADIFSRFQQGQPRFTLPSTGSAAELLYRKNPRGFNGTLRDPAAFLKTPSYTVAASMILDELVP